MSLVTPRPCIPVFLPSTKHKIIEATIVNNVGRFVSESGVEMEFKCRSGINMDEYEFATAVKLSALDPAIEWIQYQCLWETLSDVQLINFHGRFNQEFLEFLVSRLKTVSTISFTYFSTRDFGRVIASIYSQEVTELTAHVNGTSSVADEVYEAISNRCNWSLKRLMLVLADGLKPDVGNEIGKTLAGVLAVNSEVYLLYAFENSNFCMMQLLDAGFTRCGYFTLASNTVALNDLSAMQFEHYWIFQKDISSARLIVGCKKGRPSHMQIGESAYFQDDALFNVCPWYNRLNIYDKHVPAPYVSEYERDSLTSLNQEYEGVNWENESRTRCCDPQYFPDPALPWGVPIWKNTRIKKIIYREKQTFFVFTNGIYFSLPHMSMENDFFESMSQQVMPRLVIHFTTFNRRRINSRRLFEFLRSVRHLELTGFVWSGLNIEIFKHLSAETESISMMRAALDRNVLNKLNLYLPENVRKNLKYYYFDGRDTPETSLASSFNGFRNTEFKIQNLQEVMVFANRLSDSDLQYRTTIENACKDWVSITDENGVITVVLFERGHQNELDRLGFTHNAEALFPRIYTVRGEAEDNEIAMKCFSCKFRSRDFQFVVPFDMDEIE